MANDDPIERALQGKAPGEPESGRLRCEDWECLAIEALDGSLSGAQAAAFEQHRQQCSSCAQALEQSRRGAQWLRFLESQPEPPSNLVETILAATSGSGMALPDTSSGLGERPPFWRRPVLPRARSTITPGLMMPGLMMTAAMAFFSLALTIHLLGVSPRRVSLTQIHLAGLHISDLRPSAVGLTVTRQYYSLEERGAKFYDNLLLVREMEAETRELAPSGEEQPAGGGTRSAPPGQSPTSRNGGAVPFARHSRAGDIAAERLWTPPSQERGRLSQAHGSPA